MTRHITGASTSPFFDAEFAAQVSPRKAQAPYKPRRTSAKLAAVEKLAERWLNVTLANGNPSLIYRQFGQQLLATLNNAGEPKP